MSKINLYATETPTRISKLIGTSGIAGSDTKNFLAGDLLALQYVDPPATASSTGTPGQYAIDSTYAYFCGTTDTWLRVAIATW